MTDKEEQAWILRTRMEQFHFMMHAREVLMKLFTSISLSLHDALLDAAGNKEHTIDTDSETPLLCPAYYDRKQRKHLLLQIVFCTLFQIGRYY
jgi:hypothetical protein